MSRRFHSAASILLAILVSLAFASAARAASVNLLDNGGFEKALGDHPWMPSGWDTSRAGFSSVFFGRDTLEPHGGSFSVSVANASGTYPLAPNWSQALIVDHSMWGKDLVFSVWTRTMGVEGRAYIKLEAYRDTISKMSKIWKVPRDAAGRRLSITPIDDPILNLGWQREYFSDSETGWVRREVRVYVPATVNIVFVRCGLVGTGQLMLDDAMLTLETARPSTAPALQTNLLVDPGFEGDGNAWEYSLPPYPDMNAERDSTVSHTGRSSLLFTSAPVGMVQSRAGVSQVLNNRMLAGKRLRLTGYIKADSLRNGAFVSLFCQTLSGVVQNVSTDVISGTTGWEKSSVEIDVPLDSYAVWAWMSYSAPTPGRVHFDDASLVVLGDATASSKP
jgi:hypothetical protein